MSYPQPPSWPHYPPPFGQGSDMPLGIVLGELKSGQAQTIHAISAQTEVLREISERLSENTSVLSERLPAPKHPSAGEAMTWKDWAQIALAVIVVGTALAGKIPLKEALPLIGKPFGF